MNNQTKIIVRPTSCDLWWGIYGLCEQIDWEDLHLLYENGERIGWVCLNTKAHLRGAVDGLRKRPEEQDFVEAIDTYLADDQCHYWYYYDEIGEEDFYEVPYEAPKNEQGVKPRFTDIWHPDEGIDISTIKSGVQAFAKKHLGIANCEIEIQNGETPEESLKSFQQFIEKFGGDEPIKIEFSDHLIEELSQHLGQTRSEVKERLESLVR